MTKAFGVYIHYKVKNVNLLNTGASFAVLEGNDPETGIMLPGAEINSKVTAINAAKIPCFLLWNCLIPADDYDASNPSKTFPPEADDPVIAAVVRTVKNKAIHGIILAFYDKTQPNGNIWTQTWYKNWFDFLMDGIYHQTAIQNGKAMPMYFQTGSAFINSFPSPHAELDQAISKRDGIMSFKTAAGLGSTLEITNINTLPFDPSTYSPDYPAGAPFGNFYAWEICGNVLKFDGITDANGIKIGVPAYWWISGLEKLSTDTGFTFQDTPVDTTPIDTTPTGGSVVPGTDNFTEVETELKGIRAILQAILDLIKGFFNKFN